MKILIFGNPFLKQDSLPIKILPTLREIFPNIEFIETDPTENLGKYLPNLTILDTVQNIKEIKILTSINQLHTNKIFSMHDFDLAYNLKLLQKINKLNSIKIIGIPMNITKEKAIKQLSKILPTPYKRSALRPTTSNPKDSSTSPTI